MILIFTSLKNTKRARQLIRDLQQSSPYEVLIFPSILPSVVPGHRGKCRPVELNDSALAQQQSGGLTGTFVRVRTIFGFALWDTGRDFYGIIRDASNVVEPTTFRGEAETWEDRYARMGQNIEFRKQFDNL